MADSSLERYMPVYYNIAQSLHSCNPMYPLNQLLDFMIFVTNAVNVLVAAYNNGKPENLQFPPVLMDRNTAKLWDARSSAMNSLRLHINREIRVKQNVNPFDGSSGSCASYSSLQELVI